jgi:hypothetical protein
MRKDIPVHGLEKIPDSVLLKNALVRVGELESYALELEDKIKRMEKTNEVTRLDKVEARKNEYTKSLFDNLRECVKLKNKLRKENKELIAQIIFLKHNK